jgi:hypothetical protein
MTTATRPRPVNLDSKHAKALGRIIDEAQQTRFGTLSLDTRKPHHLLHLTQTFVGPKKSAPYFPHTQRVLDEVTVDHKVNGGPRPTTLFEMADPPVNTFLAAAKILYCNVLADGVTVAVGGVITMLQKPYSVSVNLVIMDMNTNQPIANVTPPISTSQYSQQVAAQGTLTQPPNVSAVLTCVITPVSGGTSITLVDTCLYQGVQSVQSVQVTDPVSRFQPPRSYIKIGLNRDSNQQPDCDYWYQYGTSGPQPIVGVAVNGSATLASGFSTSASPGFNGYLYLYRRDSLVGGGACIVFAPNSDFTQYITNQQTAFTWKFPTNTFQGAPWDQNQTVDLDFFMQFSLLQGGNPSGMGSVRVTSIPSTYVGNAPPNVGPIPPLTFVWGCLPAGTLVTTEEGDVPIELITDGMNVIGGPGRRLMNVVRTWKGWEKNPLIHITDDRGLTIRLTSEHPVMTDTGMRLASELTVGTAVLTSDGSFARLLNVERVDFDGLVYNLDVEPVDEGEDDELITTFIAGGFVVGDNRMQGECSRLALQRMIAEPSKVPSELALDIENSVRRAAGLPLTLQVTAIAG